MSENPEEPLSLAEELRALLNRHSAENESDTPDFILAEFLLICLGAFNVAVKHRSEWYGREDKPGAPAYGDSSFGREIR